MSFIFQRFDGRFSNWDYFTGLFKLLAIYGIGIRLLPFMLANFLGRSEGFESFLGVFPVATALMGLVVTWPLLALINKRKHDLTDAMRERLGVYGLVLSVAIVIVAIAQLLRATGINVGDWVSTAMAFMPFVMLGVLVLGVLPSQGGTNRYGPDPRLERGQAKTTVPQTAASITLFNIPAAVKAQKMPQSLAPLQRPLAGVPIVATNPSLPNSVVRTRKLPVDGRVKPGWFS
jgi:uncharacterized membrane protein YhaH (DUF805 family)